MFTLQLLLQSSDTDVTCNKEQIAIICFLRQKRTNKGQQQATPGRISKNSLMNLTTSTAAILVQISWHFWAFFIIIYLCLLSNENK
jgi:hypothetical protein